MKILFVNNFRGRGGGEEFLRDLLPGLAAKGVRVGLVCRPGTPLVDMFSGSDITLHPIKRSGLSTISAVFKTATVIKTGGYEIIDIQRGHDIIQSWLGALLSGKRPVLMYTPQVPEFIRSRFLLSRMKRIVTISRHIRDRIVSYFPKIGTRTSIIYYGIDLNRFKPENIRRGTIRGRFGLPPDTRIIGTVGDLWKNQVEFLDALVLIRKEIPGTRFALVASASGTGQIDVFKQRAAELGLTEAVLWTGRLSKEDMLSFYADIDVAVSTHRNEGFGIWVLEALAVGTPMVSVNEGGIRDSLEGCPAGVLVDGGPEHMAAAVIEILKNPSQHAGMAGAGPKWTAERYSRERMIDDYFRFFQSLAVMPRGIINQGRSS
jgi:glycosyltransferase involved in cell wall biosynthesis